MANQLRLTLLAVLLLSAASFSTSASVDLTKIHEYMTEDELSATFNVKNKAAVPDYDVVPIVYVQPNHAHRNRRSVPPGHHVVTIKESTLYLEPVDHYLIGEDTPVFLASGDESDPNGIRYERVENMWPNGFSLYQDPENEAAIMMTKQPDGKVNLEGLVGDDTVVKPVPSRLENATSSGYHVIFRKVPLDKLSTPEGYIDWSYWSKTPVSFTPWGIVDTVYPEILVIADHSTYLAHNKDVRALCKYMAAFWNAVDLRYRVFEEPKVRLNIAALIVATDDNGASYMMEAREEYPRRKDILRESDTLNGVGAYLYKEWRIDKDTYDFAVAITNYTLCAYNPKSKACNHGAVGLARRRGACIHDEFNYGVAVMEDHAKFDGVLTAAHEIGHLLGAEHDKRNKANPERCHEKFRFLLAPHIYQSHNAFLLSDCSISQISHFLRTEAECLRNKPVVRRPIAKKLPGELLSRDEQCKRNGDMIERQEHRDREKNECRSLYCQEPSHWYSLVVNQRAVTQPPLEGSSCSGGGMCLDGICVHKKKKIE